MTPLIGIFIAIIAAMLAPNRRAMLASVILAMIAATAIQSWDIGADLGSNPGSTIRETSYWVVQVIIITIVSGVALGVFQLRLRRAAREDRSLVRPRFSGRRGAAVVAWSISAMSALLVLIVLLMSNLKKHHGQGAGHIPWTGVVGIVVGLVILADVAIALQRGTRSTSGGQTPIQVQ